MDPNATLDELLALVEAYTAGQEPVDRLPAFYTDPADYERFVELVMALDGWLSKGGFLPKRWAGGRSNG